MLQYATTVSLCQDLLVPRVGSRGWGLVLPEDYTKVFSKLQDTKAPFSARSRPPAANEGVAMARMLGTYTPLATLFSF